MNIMKYVTTVLTFGFFAFVSYSITNPSGDGSYSTWFVVTGMFNIIIFVVLLIYNPVYNDAAKPDHVIEAGFRVENADRDFIELRGNSGDSFNDNMGYGVNVPNLIGLGLGVLSLIIGIIL